MLRKISEILKKSVSEPRQRKSWQSSIGIAIFTLFVLSTLVVNQSVQALNQAAGNYGYYGGSYGYGGSSNSNRATSDFLPMPPTALTTSGVTSTTATVSWTAPMQTVGSTSLDNLHATTPYLFHYSTSALSSTLCSGGSSTTSTSTSVSLTGLSPNTTYYVNVCTKDANLNRSDALETAAGILSGSFTTTAATGGTATTVVSGGGGGATGPTYPTGTTTTGTTTTITTGPAPVATTTSVTQSATEFGVTLSASETTTAAGFIVNGTTPATVALGSGERLALVRDQLETLGRVSLTALEQLAIGQKPTVRNLAKEQAQLAKVLNVFVRLAGHRPNFKNVKEDLAWNTMMYRIRFTRDLNKERAGITKFKAIFGRIPTSPLDWATVRAYGYALK